MPSLAPALLVSMPQLRDPNFNKTVVLLCRHHDEGAFGLIMNRPLVTSGRVVVNLDPPVTSEPDLEVWIGGPVEQHRSWILVADPEHSEAEIATRVAEGLYLSTSPDLLRRLLEPNPPPHARLIVGVRRLGAWPARSGAPVADERRGSRSDLLHAAGQDVGSRDSPARGGSGGLTNVARRSLARRLTARRPQRG